MKKFFCLVFICLLSCQAAGFSIDDAGKDQFCADMYKFTGHTDKAWQIQIKLALESGYTPTDADLQRRQDRVYGFIHGASVILNLQPLDLANYWIKDNECHKVLESVGA